MSDHTHVTVDGVDYVLEPAGDDLRIGHTDGDSITWLPETVPAASLDLDNEVAVHSVIKALADRGA